VRGTVVVFAIDTCSPPGGRWVVAFAGVVVEDEKLLL
jgi:hypothetical protein